VSFFEPQTFPQGYFPLLSDVAARLRTMVKRLKLKSLSQGRPPMTKPARSLSSKATRTLIRNHHTLLRERERAFAQGDDAKAAAISHQIESQGGIRKYQEASLLGQSNDRGGDSSKILMEWLSPIVPVLQEHGRKGQAIRMLEVGALSVKNACSRSGLFEIERIDLNSQAEGIKQQDFMERPLPRDEQEKFGIISLSLVLNYVPDASGKGEMLLRTLKFLTARKHPENGLRDFLPSLFLVLPASCVTNSRYMDEPKLEEIMESLGYVKVEKKLSNKLVYYLWRLGSQATKKNVIFKKVEIRSGKDRNNFAIVLK
jgi:25S rRNA (adenine2142-N1)-methyltransferase